MWKGREGKRKGTGSTVAAQIGIAFLEFPVIGTAPGPYVLSEEQVTEWTTLFPGLNVRQEAQKALAWVRANSGRKKTLSGMPRFLVNWLSRATDTSHPSAGSSQLLTRRNQTTLGAAARILQGGE